MLSMSVRSVWSRTLLRRLLASCFLLLGGCAVHQTPEQVNRMLLSALDVAQKHHEQGKDAEASTVINAITAVDQDLPGLRELDQNIDPKVRDHMNPGWLGMNRKQRPPVHRSLGTRALLWLPDRLLDLADVVSFSMLGGSGLFLDYHATRAFQFAGGARSGGGIGWHDHRSLGIKSQAEGGVTLIAAGTHSFVGALIGTSGIRGAVGNVDGIHRPSDPLYREFRDYWAIGGGGTVGFLGAEIDFHPMQLADFLAGFVGIDFLNDDFATTRSLQLDHEEEVLLQTLWRVRGSSRAIERYLQAKRSGILQQAEWQQPTAGAGEPMPSTAEGVPPAAPADPD
jgi:hypothetical protein